MLSSALESRRAIEANIAIMRAFTRMKMVQTSGEAPENESSELTPKKKTERSPR